MKHKSWLYALIALPVIAGLFATLFLPHSPTSSAIQPTWAYPTPPITGEGTLLFVSAGPSGYTLGRIPVGPAGSATTISGPAAATEMIPLPPGCEIGGLSGSPDGRRVAISVDCEFASSTQVLDMKTGKIRSAEPEGGHESIFQDWTQDGKAILRLDPIGASAIVIVDLTDGSTEWLDTPAYTYNAAVSPDGQRVLFTVSRGLGLGGELWIMNRDGSNKQLLLHEPYHNIAYPRWSPKGDAIAYIRMMDTNIPFTVGDLYLADGDGHNRRAIAPADAGHGYPPVWSPDGRWVAFVVRENPNSVRADNLAWELESNIYLADARSGAVRQLTHFEAALADGITWAPDGKRVALRAVVDGESAIWLVDVDIGEMKRLTGGVDAIYPVWQKGE